MQEARLTVDARQFRCHREKVAYDFWRRREEGRRVRNWQDACHQLWAEGGQPSMQQIQMRAYFLYLERREADAQEDWSDAGFVTAKLYRVV